MDMIVIVDGRKEWRRVDHIEHDNGPFAREVPVLRHGEEVFETLGGPPVIVQTGR